MNSSLIKFDQGTCWQVLDSLHDGVYIVDANRVITYWNRAAEEISGFSAAEVIGRSCAENILTHVDGEGVPLCQSGCPLAATLSDGKPRAESVFLHHKQGHRLEVSLRTFSLGREQGAIELFSNRSKARLDRAREEAIDAAARDTLLIHQGYIARELAKRVEEHDSFRIPFGVTLLRIDGFSELLAAHGEQVGHDVLAFVASTLSTNASASDLYGRWGSEEFIGISRNVTRAELAALTERVRMLIESAYIIREGGRVSVTVSVGAALATAGEPVEELLLRIEALKQSSQQAGGNRVSLD